MPELDVLKERTSAAVKKVLSFAIDRVANGNVKERIAVPILGAMVMESLRKHAAVGNAVGTDIKSFHGLLYPFFSKVPLGDAAGAAVKVYREIISKDAKKVGGMPLEDYAARMITLPIGDCLKNLEKNKLLPPSLSVRLENIPVVIYREIHAEVKRLKCENTEEVKHDEIYVVNGASIYDATGIWATRTHVSKIFNDIGAGERVPLTAIDKFLMNFSAQNGPNDQNTVSAMCTMTLIEHEYGDLEQVMAAVNAAYTAGRMIAAVAAATGPVGVAVAVGLALPSILQSLAVFLDGEDELGSFALRFENFLAGPTWDKNFPLTVAGTHILNYYEYHAFLHAFTKNVPGTAPELIMSGLQSVISTQPEGPAHAAYRFSCAAALADINWTVEWTGPAPLDSLRRPELSAGSSQREVIATFKMVGDYRLSVSAKNRADGRVMSDSIDVRVEFRSGGEAAGTPMNDSDMQIQAK